MKRIHTVIALLFIYLVGFSQIPKAPTSSLSPNAAELGKYGTIPVSCFTGVPNINIPLYNEKNNNFDLNISLSYHAGGVQPDQRAGWTGVGWSLYAGGLVSRNVNGCIDEYNNPNFGSSGSNIGFYFNHNVLNTSSWNQRDYLRGIAQQTLLKDNSPDEFSFVFGEYTGKFYIKQNGSWAVQCNKPVKVEFDGQFLSIPFQKQGRYVNFDYSKSFSGFTITTEEGTKYIFGGNTSAIEYSIDFFAQSYNEWIANSWYLTKIIQPTGQEINFYYQRGDYNCQMGININNDLGSYTESNGGIFNPQSECSSWSYSGVYYNYSGQLISPIYLSSITTPNSTITFHKSISNELRYNQEIFDWKYSTWMQGNMVYKFLPYLQPNNENYPQCLGNLKWYKLDSIISKNKYNNEKYKKVTFEYNVNNYYTISQRLFLKKITEADKIYNLNYDNIDKLPEYLSNKVDHWGYFNDTYANVDYSNYYNYRNPNSNCLTYGILSNIQYPTGGFTEFVFEPHYYRKKLSLNRWESCNDLGSNNLAGGLRIKQIKNSSTITGPSQVVKEYYYVSDYLQNKQNAQISTGILGGQVKYYFDDYIVYAFNDNNVKRKMCAFSSNSVLPSCYNSLGSHIGYSQVVEKEANNSFTIYKYTNYDNGYMDEPCDAIIQYSHTPYEKYVSKSQERGLLISSENYNSDGIKIKDKVIIYEKDNIADNYVRGMIAHWKNTCPETSVSYDEGTAYKIYTYLMRPKTETETFFDRISGSQLQSTITTYTYNVQKLIQSILTTNSNNTTYETKIKYPGDSYFNNYQGQSHPFQQMQIRNMINYPIEQKTFVNNKLTAATITTYMSDNTSTTTGKILPNAIYGLNTNTPLTDFTALASGDGNTAYTIDPRMSQEITYNYYSDGNVREVFSPKTGITTTYLWSYNGQYPVAEIKNATYTQVNNAYHGSVDYLRNLIAPTNEVISSMSGLLRSNLPNSQITTYTYKHLVGMTSATDPRGATTYYEYDDFNRLKETYIIENGVKKFLQKYEYHYQNQ